MKTKLPGTFRLEQIRSVIRSISQGAATSSLIGVKTGISSRHVSFAVNSAQVLGWIDGDAGPWTVTAAGKALLATDPGSVEEARAFRDAIVGSAELSALAPGLLATEPPEVGALTEQITGHTGLSQASAKRGARVLLSWRRQALDRLEEAAPEKKKTSPPPKATPTPSSSPPPDQVPITSGPLRMASVRIENLEAFHAAKAELRPVTVLYGRVGSGKATFVDSLTFVGEALHIGVPRAVEEHGRDLDDLLCSTTDGCFNLAFELDLPEDLRPEPHLERARYELAVGLHHEPSVRWEALFLRPAGARLAHTRTEPQKVPGDWRQILGVSGRRGAWYRAEKTRWKTDYKMSRRRLVLSALPDDPSRFPASLAVRSFFRRGIKPLSINTSLIRKPCSPMAGVQLLNDASNLATVVSRLREADPDRFQRWLAQVRKVWPRVEDIDVQVRDIDLHLSIHVAFKGGYTLGCRRLSPGTLRYLALSILPFAGDSWALYIIDDSSLTVDATAIDALSRSWFEADGAGQIIVTTCSPLWARLIRQESLLCLRHDDDGVADIVTARSYEPIKSWRQSVDRGQLLASALPLT